MREADTYRGARRNDCRWQRGFAQWREIVSDRANAQAILPARAVQANSAREAAAKALVDNRALRPDIVASSAMLDFYRGEKRTRAVNRIIRGLEQAVRAK